MKKILTSIITAMFIGLFYVQTALAAGTATIYVSPSSSSVTVGQNFSVSLRINSGGDKIDTVSVSLSFTSSRILYTGYSDTGAAFSSFSTSGSGSSFSTTRVKYGGYTTGDQKIVTLNFKALSAGSTSLTVSSASSAYSGGYLTTSKGNGSVSISSGSSGSSGGSSSSSGGGTYYDFSSGTTTKSDTTAPKLKGNPTITPDYGDVKVSFESDENSKAQIIYGTDKRNQKTAESGLVKKHEIIIGKDKSLDPGTKYSFVIKLTDKEGNSSTSKVFSTMTKGYTVQVKILDLDKKPLANHSVTLHSDPITVNTDGNGLATFSNVAPGKHTLSYEIDGVKLTQEITVANSVSLAGGSDDPSKPQEVTITLPFALTENSVVQTNSTNPAKWVIAAAISGLMVGALVTLYRAHIETVLKRIKGYVLVTLGSRTKAETDTIKPTKKTDSK